MIEAEFKIGDNLFCIVEVKVRNKVLINKYLHFYYFMNYVFPKKYRSSKTYKFLGYLSDLKEDDMKKYTEQAKLSIRAGYISYIPIKKKYVSAVDSFKTKILSEKIDINKNLMVFLINAT